MSKAELDQITLHVLNLIGVATIDEELKSDRALDGWQQ